MKIQSAKSKGRRGQKEVVAKILGHFPQLSERDVRSTSMGVTGDDIQLSEAATLKFPFSVEVKNQEKLNIWEAIKQVEARAKLKPLVIFKRNGTELYCVIKFDHLLEVLNYEA